MSYQSNSSNKIELWIKVGLFVFVFIAFSHTMKSEFLLLDDDLNVYKNPTFNNIELKTFFKLWAQPYEHLYIPVTYSLWAILYSFSNRISGGIYPVYFHFSNMLIHTINTIIVFSIIKRIINYNKPDELKTYIIALVGAIFFAVHPIQTEPVAWISGMKDILYTFFALLSLCYYLDDADKEKSKNSIISKKHIAFVLFVLAICSKPTAVILPFIIVSLEVFIFKKPIISTVNLLPWIIVSVALIILAKNLMPPPPEKEYLPWHLRPVLAIDTMLFYLRKILWPSEFIHDYGRTIKAASSNFVIFYFSTAFVAILLYVQTKIKAAKLLIVFLIVFFISILPYSGIIPFEFQRLSTVADRYAYFGVFIFCLFLCIALNKLKTSMKTLISLAVILTAFFTFKTITNLKVWENDITLGEHTLKYNSSSTISYINIGIKKASNGLFDEAITNYQNAINIDPDAELAYFNMGIALAAKGNIPEALLQTEKLKKIQPQKAENLKETIFSIKRKLDSIPARVPAM
jgi:protein O-mannosyl-transferase